MKLAILSFMMLLFASCLDSTTPTPNNDDVVKQVSKEGSIETTLSVSHQTGYDVLVTTHNVWVKGQLSKTLVTRDTLQTLGTMVVQQDAEEDDDGNIIKPAQQAEIPKNYELYITVK